MHNRVGIKIIKQFVVAAVAFFLILQLQGCSRPYALTRRWGDVSMDRDVICVNIIHPQPFIFIPISGNRLLKAELDEGNQVGFEQTGDGVLLYVPGTVGEITLHFEDRIRSAETTRTGDYLAFLYDNMPLPDMMVNSLDFWTANVNKTLEIRDRMGWNIPEREFRHFVLPLRVNNESLDDFRTEYADILCDRVKGMSLGDSALELNHWCHEMATYHPSDARTSSPLATIRSGVGRCGEESVLAVSAFRAAGIPARQVYTPRWAHTDDNHAWVEVWVDGKWHFLGACEPEPVLDRAWFNGPVSRALLLHTKAFGNYVGDEDVISRTEAYTEINVIGNYVPTRKTEVKVVDDSGASVSGADVEYKIYNYAEFYTVARYKTEDSGIVSLNTGCGDMLVWASKGDRFGFAIADSSKVEIILNHYYGEEFSFDVEIVPPCENPLPSSVSDTQNAENQRRLADEDISRENRPKGNDVVLSSFRNKWADHSLNAEALLLSLSEKDLNDVSAEVLDDAMVHCGGKFEKYRDCPRIELEFLYPFFEELGAGLHFDNPAQIKDWVSNNIYLDDRLNPQGLRIPPVFVWRDRIADKVSLDIFFVALCRAKGFYARINEVTGKAQYFEDNVWKDFDSIQHSPQGSLTLSYEFNGILRDPQYYSHFTLAELSDGTQHLLTLPEDNSQTVSRVFSTPFALDAAYYSLTSGSRMGDGSVLAHIAFFNVNEGENASLPLEMRKAVNNINVIGHMDASCLLPITGRGFFVLAFLGDKDEPTVHARGDFESIAPSLNAWGGKTVVVSSAQETGIKGVEGLAGFDDKDGLLLKNLLDGCESDFSTLPVIAVADSFGNVVYLSQGYNTSLAEDLRRIISEL